MNGRAHIGVGIELIKGLHKPNEKIIPLELRGTKVLAVGINPVNDQRDGISNHNEPHQAAEGGNIVKQGIHMNAHKISKPEHIRNHENFLKGYVIIQRRVNGMVFIEYKNFFRQLEQNTEYGPENEQPQMPVFVGIQLAGVKFTVINNRGIEIQFSVTSKNDSIVILFYTISYDTSSMVCQRFMNFVCYFD